jgi:hypothetical protein
LLVREYREAAVAETTHAISARSWWWREFEPIVRLLSATITVGAASGAHRRARLPACHGTGQSRATDNTESRAGDPSVVGK